MVIVVFTTLVFLIEGIKKATITRIKEHTVLGHHRMKTSRYITSGTVKHDINNNKNFISHLFIIFNNLIGVYSEYLSNQFMFAIFNILSYLAFFF